MAERLHQLPAGEVGDADIAQLAGAHEVVERRQHLLDRRAGVEGMQLQQVDVVGAEAAQRGLDAAIRREREEPASLGPSPIGSAGLGGDASRRRGGP